MKDKEKVKRIAIYVLSVVLLVVFVIIPYWYIINNPSGGRTTCNNICPNGEVKGVTDDGYCECSDGTIIDPDNWSYPENNESE